MSLKILQDRVFRFVNGICPDLTYQQQSLKVQEEANELAENPDDLDEYADVLISVLHAARLKGISANHLIVLAHEKMDINEKRKWGEPDENGIRKHN